MHGHRATSGLKGQWCKGRYAAALGVRWPSRHGSYGRCQLGGCVSGTENTGKNEKRGHSGVTAPGHSLGGRVPTPTLV